MVMFLLYLYTLFLWCLFVTRRFLLGLCFVKLARVSCVHRKKYSKKTTLQLQKRVFQPKFLLPEGCKTQIADALYICYSSRSFCAGPFSSHR